MPTTRTDASTPRLVAPEKRPALSAVRRTAVTVATASLAAVALLPLAVPAGASPVTPDGAARSSVSFVLAQTPQQAGQLASLARDGRRGRSGFAATVPSRSRHDAVTSWARSHGYAVVHDGPFVVQVTGSADALAADLGTSLSRSGALHATSAPQVPAALAGTVASVVGLDERPAFRHQVAYSPTQLQTMSGLVSSVLDPTAGLGTTVGTVNLGPWYAGDLTTFAAAKGLTVAPGQVTPVSVDGSSTVADPATDDGSSAEVALDVEAVLATAPAAKQRQYFSANTFAGYVAILDQMTADAANGLLHTASSSWGLCEQYESSSTLSSQSAAVQRLVAAGATFFASSGDDGANDCGDSSLAVDYPASDPFTVGVGGVHATTGTSGWSFSAWGSSTPLVTGAGGGGTSAVFARPAYQSGTGISTTMRTVPDIAALADPATGFAAYETFDGGWVSMGGTSLAAPMSAAGLAVVEGRTLSGPLGNVLPALYAHPSAFRDVTTGTNGAWTAGPGYDRVTGLGVPDWTAVATAMALGTVTTSPSPSPSPSPTASPTDVAAPTTGLRVTWTGSTSPTYRVDRTFSDPLPSSGFGTFTLTTLDRTTGVTTTTGSTATSSTLRVQPGHSYTLTVTSTDLAGHTSAPVSAAFRAPSDDRALGFSSGWSRQLDGHDYSGTHTVSATAGQTLRLLFRGRTATVGFVRTSSSGYADVYVDGVRTARLDLYAASNSFRVPVRVMTAADGKHLVVIRVVGAHRAASHGSRVYVDSFSWA